MPRAAGWGLRMAIFRSARLAARDAFIHVSPVRHIPSMRALTRLVAAVVTAAVVPACSVIASSVALADPVATTATVLKVVDGDTVDIVDDVRGRLRIRLLGIDTPETKKPGYTVGCWGLEASEFVEIDPAWATCRLRHRPEPGHVRPLRPDLGLLGQGRRLGLLGRSGPRGCYPFVHLSQPSCGPC
jgi:Staphylococcal nuclease homologue